MVENSEHRAPQTVVAIDIRLTDGDVDRMQPGSLNSLLNPGLADKKRPLALLRGRSGQLGEDRTCAPTHEDLP
jgi:hypothetical protein